MAARPSRTRTSQALLALFTTAPFTLSKPAISLPVSFLWPVKCPYDIRLIYSMLETFAMADSSESRPVARATKPVSEALLNEKVWTLEELPPKLQLDREVNLELSPWLIGTIAF